MKYETILFDADGTLFDFIKSESVSVREAFLSFGISVDDAIVDDYSAINDSLWKMLERGEIEKQVLLYRRFEILCEKYGFSCDAKLVAKAYMDRLSEKIYFIDGAQELCKSLCGIAKLYIVTNGVEFIQKNRYAKSGLDKYFSGIFISGEIGSEKPSVDYFEYVAKHIPDFKKDKTVIVGDSLTSDIKGGIAYGIDTCWYNPAQRPMPQDMDITCNASSFEDVYRFVTGG